MARFALLCTAAFALTLSACADPKPAATPRSIVFPNVDEDNIVEITQKAEEYCLHYGRHAQMVADDWPDGRATFNCVQ